jgi:hypothetical protein
MRRNRPAKLHTIRIVIGTRVEIFELRDELLPNRKESLRRAALLHDPSKELLERRKRIVPMHPVKMNDCDLTPESYDFLDLDRSQFEPILTTTSTDHDFGSAAGAAPGDGGTAVEQS